MELANKLFKGDRSIWIVFMIFILISMIEVFSASSALAYKLDDYWSIILRHGQMFLIGGAAVLVILQIPVRWLSLGVALLPISICFLILTLLGGEEINGSSRWFSLLGFKFQPSEIAKLACIIFMSFCLSNRKKFSEAQVFWYILGGVIPVCGLIIPENVSTAVLLYGVMVVFMFIGQISLKWLGMLMLVSLLAVALAVALIFAMPDKYLEEHPILAKVKHRLTTFVEPENVKNAKTYVIDDDNRQTTYAKIAIANGGIGKFPGLGQQRETLPLAYADYIYAIIIEEMGVVFGIIVMLLYIIILIRAGVIARKCEKLFPKYLVLGSSILIGVQAFVNMAVVVDLFPVTGQPLPLISRGGTSTVITCVYIGIILSVSRFGAGIGNEEEEEEEENADDIVEIDSDIDGKNPVTVLEQKS
jgi:cell division protein FtsW